MSKNFSKAPCAVALLDAEELWGALGPMSLQRPKAEPDRFLQGVALFQEGDRRNEMQKGVGRQAP